MQKYVYDTETDMVEGFSEPRTVTVQVAPLDIATEDEVIVFEGLDCLDQLLDWMESGEKNQECYVYNLDYEWSRIERFVRARLVWWEKVEEKERQPPGTFSDFGDNHFDYKITLVFQNGVKVTLKDDWQYTKKSMEQAAVEVYSEKPDLWPKYVTKDDLKVGIPKEWYNSGWSQKDHPLHDKMMAYAIRDAYSQAKISVYNEEVGYHRYVTGTSYALNTALKMRYKKKNEEEWNDMTESEKDRYAQKAFTKDNNYPPLEVDRQHYVEDHILGGFVYGQPGVHKGTYTHVDYKSSYPDYYYEGELFKGCVQFVPYESEIAKRVLKMDNMFKWIRVSFKFDGVKEHGLPLIQGSECWFDGKRPAHCWNHKMRKGEVKDALYTLNYWEELQRHYNVYDVEEKEIWYARKAVGDFKEFVAEEYFLKEVYKALGLKGLAEIHKRNMNGGIHGKTITKTRRQSVTYATGNREYVMNENEPVYCSMVGFTAMMERRRELVMDCRIAQENGMEVMMNDTDSIILRATEIQVREVYGDKIAIEDVCGGMTVKDRVKQLKKEHPNAGPEDIIEMMRVYKGDIVSQLGRFEIERSEFTGKTEFDEFRCWGLKRYLELEHGEYRKSAFAGMSDKNARFTFNGEDVGQRILMDIPCDGTPFVWFQDSMKRGEWGKYMVTKRLQAMMQDIYYVPIEELPKVDKRGMCKGDSMEIEICDNLNKDIEEDE